MKPLGAMPLRLSRESCVRFRTDESSVRVLEILPVPIASNIVDIGIDQLLGDRSGDAAVADGDTVYVADGADAVAGRRDENFLRVHGVVKVDIRFFDRQVLFPC